MTDAEEWRESAVCRQVDPDLWFPEAGDNGFDAKRVCRTCPVQPECLEFAVQTGARDGIWGGKAPEELLQIRKQRGLARPGIRPTPVAEVLDLARLGWTAEAIAAAVDCTPRSVWRVLKAHREVAT